MEGWNAEIEKAFEQTLSFISEDNNGACLIDPNDGARVLGHYGETHFCAAALMRARRLNLPKYREIGLKFFDALLKRWDSETRSPEYHDDFNNFALALIYEELKALGETELAEKAMRTLTGAKDSRNRTVNWLPMRAYANLVQYEATKNASFLNIAIDALNVVKDARYEDGMFDDLLPKGASFNLQYCISTAAVVQLIARRFPEYADKLPKIDLTRTMQTLYALVFPDGDINYMGRGCNQIFAWGPWLYLTENFVEKNLKAKTRNFLEERFPTARDNNSLLLNGYNGADRTLWWDYHHYTVYLSHLMMWNELAENADKTLGVDVTPADPVDSGVSVYRSDSYFAVTFAGRAHYLIEKGPAVVGVWSKKHGVVFKCGHASAGKKFSNKSFNPLTAYAAHWGLLEIDEASKKSKNKLVRKLLSFFPKTDALTIKPTFAAASIKETSEGLEFKVVANSKPGAESVFAVPSYVSLTADNAQVYAGDALVKLRRVGSVPTQYGDAELYMSDVDRAQEWRLIVK